MREEKDIAALLSQFFHVINKKESLKLRKFFTADAKIYSSFAGKDISFDEYERVVHRARSTLVDSVFFDDVRIILPVEDGGGTVEALGILSILYKNGQMRGREYRIVFHKSEKGVEIESMHYPS